jgi:hypothetical protein
VAERLHRLQAGGEEGEPDTFAARFRVDAGRAEEAARRRVVAGKAQQLAVVDGDQAGNRLAGEGDGDFACPVLAELFANPSGDEMQFRGEGRTDGDADIIGFPFQVGELSGLQAHKQVWHLSLLQLFRYCGMYPLLVL